MSNIITKRSEILFLYDIQNANPNGDPSDENKPRIDEETGLNIVTDVRLKRTVRDYLMNYAGYNGKDDKDIFIRHTFINDTPEKGLKDAKARAKDFNEKKEDIIQKCIDIRLFGGVLPLEKASITFTGPVQFKIGHSLHRVQLQHIKGTGAFASSAGDKQNTFREEYILPYSFIAFYGIINENAAQYTKLTDDDIELLKDALWNGTKNLISRSKMEHNPRMLLILSHQESNYFIGELDRYIKLDVKDNLDEEAIRSINDFTLNLSDLNVKINALKESGNAPEVFLLKDDNLNISGWNI